MVRLFKAEQRCPVDSTIPIGRILEHSQRRKQERRAASAVEVRFTFFILLP
jgi:hypothetical protein